MTDQELADRLLAELQRQYPKERWHVTPPSTLTKDDPRFLQGAFIVVLERKGYKSSQMVSSDILGSAHLEPFVHILGQNLMYRVDKT